LFFFLESVAVCVFFPFQIKLANNTPIFRWFFFVETLGILFFLSAVSFHLTASSSQHKLCHDNSSDTTSVIKWIYSIQSQCSFAEGEK
jgi:hypothetical protein